MSSMQWLRDNLDILRPAGVLLLGLLGTFYVPSALERAKLRQSVYATINESMENLTSRNSASKRDVTISGLNYMLNSPELGRSGGGNLLGDICCAILNDYEYAGDARGVMNVLKKNGVPMEKYAHRLSKYAVVIDKDDMRGGIDADFMYVQGESTDKRKKTLLKFPNR